DATERAIETRGYEQTAIADLLDELHISSGAFYHYFDSKPALLSALVERMGERLEQRVLPIIHDPTLHALDKLQRVLSALDQEKLAHKKLVLSYLRVLYADENAIFRYKMYAARIKRLAPWLEEIIQQGVEEGTLTTPYPDQAARMVISLFEDLAYATVDLLLSEKHSPDDLSHLARIATACADAIERVLGAPTGCLQHTWRDELEPWLQTDKQR
ncbi:MAG TPA: TetR/AcrR family transcriptional regulator, partial [Ktedonobacteraceae bacterium]